MVTYSSSCAGHDTSSFSMNNIAIHILIINIHLRISLYKNVSSQATHIVIIYTLDILQTSTTTHEDHQDITNNLLLF
jgi:hypothetical protein